MSKAEEFFKENVIWNGTVIINPIQLMESYHQSRVNAISDTTEYKNFILKWGFERGQPLFADITEDLKKLLKK